MANRARITVRLNRNDVKKFLKSPAVQKVLKGLASEIATDTENRYRADGKDYKFNVYSMPVTDRARMVVGSKDGDHARYSEAARGHLLDEVQKKRNV